MNHLFSRPQADSFSIPVRTFAFVVVLLSLDLGAVLHAQTEEPLYRDWHYNRLEDDSWYQHRAPEPKDFSKAYGATFNLPIRLGMTTAMNVNIHDVNVRLLSRRLSNYLYLNPSAALPAGNTSLATALGISTEFSLPNNFALNMRLTWAAHSAAISSTLEAKPVTVPLHSVGLEVLGVYQFDKNLRGQAGLSLVGLRDNPFVGVLCSPMVGLGYDIDVFVQPSGKKGKWILTPEITAMMSIGNIIAELPVNEYWSLAQVRIGFSLTHQFAHNP